MALGEKGRRYRRKIEVLRDFLEATHQEGTKSRIIGIANLNRALFRRYLDLAVSFDLVVSTSGGYRLTPRARPALEAIDRYLARSEEAKSALQELRRVCDEGRGKSGPKTPNPSSDIIRVLVHPSWTEVRRAPAEPAWEGPSPRSSTPKPTPGRRNEWWLEDAAMTETVLADPGRERATPRSRPRTLHRDGPSSDPKRKQA